MARILEDRAEALCHPTSMQRQRWHRTSVLSIVALSIISMSAQMPSFTTIAKGDASGQQEAKQVLIRTDAEWKALWKDHSATEKMPSVDFAKSMVVGIFLGSKPSTGHAL